MNIKNIQNKIKQMGGTSEVTIIERSFGDTIYKLIGRIQNYKIEFTTNCASYFTALKDGTKFDMGSDYNPGGYIFFHKIKDMDYLLK